jgi:hypothetical protein
LGRRLTRPRASRRSTIAVIVLRGNPRSATRLFTLVGPDDPNKAIKSSSRPDKPVDDSRSTPRSRSRKVILTSRCRSAVSRFRTAEGFGGWCDESGWGLNGDEADMPSRACASWARTSVWLVMVTKYGPHSNFVTGPPPIDHPEGFGRQRLQGSPVGRGARGVRCAR